MRSTPPFTDKRRWLCCSGYSKQLNDSRIKVLQAQEDAIQSLVHEAQEHLGKITSDKKGYKTLMTNLITQV